MGGSGSGSGAVRVFVNVHTTTSPLAIVPSTFVPGTETAGWPFRVQVDLRAQVTSDCVPTAAVSLTVPSPIPTVSGPVVVPFGPVMIVVPFTCRLKTPGSLTGTRRLSQFEGGRAPGWRCSRR